MSNNKNLYDLSNTGLGSITSAIKGIASATSVIAEYYTNYNSAFNNFIQSPGMKKLIKHINEVQNVITTNFMNSTNTYNKYYSPLIQSLQNALKNPSNISKWYEYTRKLSEYFWIMPYDLDENNINDILTKCNSIDEYDNYMTKYFTETKIEELFKKIKNYVNNDGEKLLIKQIQHNFKQENFIISNLALYSLIDNELSFFLKDKCVTARKKIFEPIIKDLKLKEIDYSVYFLLEIINNSINDIFHSTNFSKSINLNNNKGINRHASIHGKLYSNNKLSTIILLNVLYYILELQESLKDYKNQLIYVANNTEFKLNSK